MTAKNDVTGDSIKTKASNPDAYAEGWDRIFGSKKNKGTRALSGSSVRRRNEVTVEAGRTKRV